VAEDQCFKDECEVRSGNDMGEDFLNIESPGFYPDLFIEYLSPILKLIPS
jgi:hypothetical protein